MDLRALKDEASRQLARGKVEKALELYWRLLELDPTDPHLRLRHAETCQRAGLKGRAIASYRVAAELFWHQGHKARAVASIKLALELSPNDPALEQARKLFQKNDPAAAKPVRRRAITLADSDGPILAVVHDDNDETTPEAEALKAQPSAVQWLSDRTVAVRARNGKWVVVSASGPLKVNEVSDLNVDVDDLEATVPRARRTDDLMSEADFQRLCDLGD